MNRNIDKLRTLMSISANASESKIMEAFDSIADYLKNYCVIKAKDGEYRILDFEFYFFNQNHQDITTHPRNSEALCWYINDFGGIDLNFKSEIKINKDPIKKKGFEIYSYKYILSKDSYSSLLAGLPIKTPIVEINILKPLIIIIAETIKLKELSIYP